MSTDNSDDSTAAEQTHAGKEIAEAVSRAQTALNRYDHTRKSLASQGVDPEHSQELYTEVITLDAAVMDAYRKLRKYIRVDVADDWWNSKILAYDDGLPIILGGRDGDDIEIDDDDFEIEEVVGPDQVRYIEEYQGAVETERVETWQEFEGFTETVNHEPALMPIAAYRRAVRYLDEIRNEIGFAPEAREPPTRTEISEEMIDDVKETIKHIKQQ